MTTSNVSAQPQPERRTLRQCLTSRADETLVYGVDLTSDPPYSKYWLNLDPLISLKCARALPLATERDVVILHSLPNHEYIEWLKQIGLGPGKVVAYPAQNITHSLADLVFSSPEPVVNALGELGASSATYVPFYGGKREAEVAKKLGINFFGCAESITLSYYDKGAFKARAQRLGIPTVEGEEGKIKPKLFGFLQMSSVARVVGALLRNHSALIVRGTLGASGSSAYQIDPLNVDEVLKQIYSEHPKGKFLIEPLLNVIVSPNDQWCICADGTVVHLDLTAQIFTGLKHGGNLSGQYFSPRVSQYISETSEKIVKSMAADGYRGVVGIDYIVTNDSIFPIENNARLNGSTFAIGIVDRLEQRHGPIHAWKFFRAKVPPCAFSALIERVSSVLYTGNGINRLLPFDADKLPIDGSFTALLVAEDIYHIQYLEGAIEAMGIERV